jgi:ornithine cyclodeaminase/alanine dehydrogenase-like protein (mu-crystallin family)
VHASTLTAFRTALSSACLVAKRNNVKSITAFGCGQQAFWHIRLALLYKGHTVRHVNIINRRFSDNCKTILKRLYSVPSHIKEREGWAECQFSVLTPGYGEFGRLLREQTRSADVIFCCTPSTEPLFDHNILTSHEGRRKGRLIVAIGSFTPRMRELPVELLLQAVKAQERGHHHYHKHATEGGVVIVDTLDGALKESGEIIEAGLTPKQLIE